MIDFRRDKDGVPARVASIEYDPNRSARIALLLLRRRGKAVHHRARRPEGRGPRRERPGSAADGGQLPAAEEDSAGDGGPQRRDAAGPRGAAVPQCGLERHAAGSRSELGADQPAQRRDSPRAGDLPGHDRQGWQRGSYGGRVGQGRPQALAGPAARTCAARR